MNNEKEIYETPSAEIILLSAQDLFASSTDYGTDILPDNLFN